jgi:AraC-like DNA-binding protein
MEDNAILIISTAVVMCCIVMATVFLSLPLPTKRELNKYRISLRFLTGAYLLMALLKIYLMVFDVKLINIISIENLLLSVSQALLFSTALITLLNPKFDAFSFLRNKIFVLIVLMLSYLILSLWWENPEISTFESLKENLWQPCIIVRQITLLYYIYLLIVLTKEFQTQEKNYLKEIDNYYADNSTLKLTWVKYCFYAALIIGLIALSSFIIISEVFSLYIDVIFTLFYLFFGLFYIQYPRTFEFIEPAFITIDGQGADISKNTKRNNWSELKAQILSEKYYLTKSVNIADMAQHLKIGRTSLSNMINNEEKMNFNSWINMMRIEEAKRIINDKPNINMANVAETVGYSELSNFSKQFKICTGKTPSSWRPKQ